ncbi:MAG: F0F1 ATP synthase subunit delta [Gammaproteobacteria bacterium]
MTEHTAIARPYARAVFALACDGGDADIAGWGDALARLSTAVGDAQIAAVVRSPLVGADDTAAVVLAVTAKAAGITVTALAPEFINLVNLLAHNRRLAIAPQIARAYAKLRAEAQGILAVRVTSAAVAAPRQRKQFAAALQKKLGRTIELEFAVDPALLGGGVVRAGDSVMDGSVRAGLRQLAAALSA